jgi:hypothetical protein
MTKPLIQIGDEVREMTDDEFEQYKLDQEAEIQRQAQVQAEAEVKAQAKANLLERLGITEDEAKLLLA